MTSCCLEECVCSTRPLSSAQTPYVLPPPVLLSFSCPSPLFFLPLLHCLPHHLRCPSPEKIKNIPGVGFGVCCCACASLARRAVRVSGVDAFSGAPGQRSEVVCAREARETAGLPPRRKQPASFCHGSSTFWTASQNFRAPLFLCFFFALLSNLPLPRVILRSHCHSKVCRRRVKNRF